MYNYSDSLRWYVSDELLTAELPLFTDVYMVFTAEDATLTYSTFEELQRNFTYSRVQSYSVERASIDTVILTCKYIVGTPTVHSLALTSTRKVNGEDSEFLICKISRADDGVVLTNSSDRVFKLPLPFRKVNGLKVYPNISTRLRKLTVSPVGNELVSVGEHHHSVQWESDKDSVPVLGSSASRYVASAEFNQQEGYRGTSYVLSESGTLNPKVASVTGRLTTPASADLNEVSSAPSRMLTNVISETLATIMEEYLMATNSIQILGHSIDSTSGYDDLAQNDKFILYTDKTESSDDRKLKAITNSDFRKTLVQYFKVAPGSSSSEVNSNACVTIVEAKATCHIKLNKTSQVCFVFYPGPAFVAETMGIKVYYPPSNSYVLLCPGEMAAIVKDSNGGYAGFKQGSTDLIGKILKGEVGFRSIAMSLAAGDQTGLTKVLNSVGGGKYDLTLTGKASINQTLTVDGDTTLKGNLVANTANKTATLSTVAVDKTLTVTESASIESLNVTSSMSADTITAGTKLQVGDGSKFSFTSADSTIVITNLSVSGKLDIGTSTKDATINIYGDATSKVKFKSGVYSSDGFYLE